MKRILLMSALLAVLLAGCGSSKVMDYIKEQFPLVDVVQSQLDSDDESYVYRAENKSVEELASELRGQEEPTEMGEYNNGKQALIYDNQFVILTQDPDNSDHTLVEVSSEEFVRDNYNPGFFQGMLLGSLLSDWFGNNWDKNRCNPRVEDCYEGYGSSGGGYYGSWGSGGNNTSGRGSTFRGGGPGAGK